MMHQLQLQLLRIELLLVVAAQQAELTALQEEELTLLRHHAEVYRLDSEATQKKRVILHEVFFSRLARFESRRNIWSCS